MFPRVGSALTPATVDHRLGPTSFHESLNRVCGGSTSPGLRHVLRHANSAFAQGRSLSHRGSECLRIKLLRGEPDADTGVFDSTSNLQLIAPVRHHDHGHPRGECSLGDAHPTVTDDGSSAREDRTVGKETLQDCPVRRDVKIGRVVGSSCRDDEVTGCGQGLESGLDESAVALLLGRACDEHDGTVDLVEPLRWRSVFGSSRSDEPVRGRPFVSRVVELRNREIQHQRSQGEGYH